MDTPSTALAVIPAELVEAVAKTGLAPDSALTVRDAFAPHFVEFHKLAGPAALIAVNAPIAARVARLALKAVRCASENTRTALKESINQRGRAIDSVNAILEIKCKEIEDRLKRIEDAEALAEAERKAALVTARTAGLLAYGVSGQFYNLGDMPAADYETLLGGIKAQSDAAKAAANKAAAGKAAAEVATKARVLLTQTRLELLAPYGVPTFDVAELSEGDFAEVLGTWEANHAAAVAREAAEIAERDRIKAENDRLRAEAVERDRLAGIESARLKGIADAAEAVAKAQRDAHDKALQDERDRHAAEALRLRAETAAATAKAQADKDAAAAVEAARVKAEKAKARRLAAEPDKKKLDRLALVLEGMAPVLTTDEGKALAEEVNRRLIELSQWIQAEASKL